MLKRKSPLLLSALFIISLTACNLPGAQGSPLSDLEMTITAQALLLATDQGTATPGFTSTPQFTPTITLTPTPSVPTVTVSVNTNCRTGPGQQYDLIGALTIGQSAEVVGKNSSVANYWVIKNPNGSGTCWLWGQYATVSGNTSGLTEFAVPATPTPSPTPTLAPPAPVKNLTANKICIPMGPNFQYTGTITWEDDSDIEEGFNIYINGAFATALGENVEVFGIPPLILPPGLLYKFGVEAFNDSGKSATKEVTFTCP